MVAKYYLKFSAWAAIIALLAAAGMFIAVLVTSATTPCGGMELVSRASGASGAKGNVESDPRSISPDGRFVALASNDTNLHPDDSDTDDDALVRDRQTNQTVLASRASGASGAKGNDWSAPRSISSDGQFVAFQSEATNLHPADTDSTRDVFVRDLQTNQTVLVSRATGTSGAKANDYSGVPSGSADGRFVAFESEATNLHPDDTDSTRDVFVRDLQTNQTVLVSRASGTAGAKGNGPSRMVSASSDGRFVAFQSEATNLHPDDTDATGDVYVRDLQTNQTVLASRATGTPGTKGNGDSAEPSVSSAGRFVAFSSSATNLHPDDPDPIFDVYVRDVQTNQTVLASRATGGLGAKANSAAFATYVSAGGRFVAFQSEATNLHPDDTDSTRDVFVRDLQTNRTVIASRAGPTGPKGNGDSGYGVLSGDGRLVAFVSLCHQPSPRRHRHKRPRVHPRTLSRGILNPAPRLTRLMSLETRAGLAALRGSSTEVSTRRGPGTAR